jgi:RNA polymerase-interacting CarD/CdnL/TRCF family regulator
MKEFRGGYYFAIIETLQTLKDKEYSTKEIYGEFEKKFGSGNIITFRKALKHLRNENKIKSKKGKNNALYHKLIKKNADRLISNIGE